MEDIELRAEEASRLWAAGDSALTSGYPEGAYRLYTQAHDLIMDCAPLHEAAHRKLRIVTRQRSPRWDFYTDTLLLALAPLGIFHLISFALRSKVGASALCRGRSNHRPV